MTDKEQKKKEQDYEILAAKSLTMNSKARKKFLKENKVPKRFHPKISKKQNDEKIKSLPKISLEDFENKEEKKLVLKKIHGF